MTPWDNLRYAWAETKLMLAEVRECIKSLIHCSKGGWQ